MPVEAKPLFRPDVLRAHLAGFELPAHVDAFRPNLAHWADLLASGKANTFKEQEILPDFLSRFFCELLGYTGPADGGPRYTISREKHVQVDGKFADAVLGDFGRGPDKFIVALEGKGPKDPLEQPFAGRRLAPQPVAPKPRPPPRASALNARVWRTHTEVLPVEAGRDGSLMRTRRAACGARRA